VLKFQKAVKSESKGRVALIGPAGSGKSYTMLTLARELAGPSGRIAAVDTEHGSLSKYADLFDFDVIELDSFSPQNFQAALEAAGKAGYTVFCCDSLSHFWVGKDGALEFVDEKKRVASAKGGDGMAGWKDFRPHERGMVDQMLASPCHVIVTMRTKNEYREEQYTDQQGRTKSKRVKIGLAPVQREGMEYEFDLVGYMSDENSLVVDKSRCPALAGKALVKPGGREFAPFLDWLRGAPARPVTTAAPPNIRPAQQAAAPPPAASAENPEPWKNAKTFAEFAALKVRVGDENYYRGLKAYGVEHANKFKSGDDARNCYKELLAIAKQIEAEAAAAPPVQVQQEAPAEGAWFQETI
jgi:hypothetical protein